MAIIDNVRALIATTEWQKKSDQDKFKDLEAVVGRDTTRERLQDWVYVVHYNGVQEYYVHEHEATQRALDVYKGAVPLTLGTYVIVMDLAGDEDIVCLRVA